MSDPAPSTDQTPGDKPDGAQSTPSGREPEPASSTGLADDAGQRPAGAASEIDWKAKARHEEDRYKKAQGQIDDLTKRLGEAEAGSQRAADLEAQIAQRDVQLLRHQAAVEAGIPHLAQRLVGTTSEELAADAKALVAGMSNPLAGRAIPGAGGLSSDPASARKSFADALFNRM